QPVERERARRVDERIHRTARHGSARRGDVGIVPVHVVARGVGDVERLCDGDRRRSLTVICWFGLACLKRSVTLPLSSTSQTSRNAYSSLSAVVIISWLVVVAAVNGWPAAMSASIVRAKLDSRFCKRSGVVAVLSSICLG